MIHLPGPMRPASDRVLVIGGISGRWLSPWQWTQFVSNTSRTGANALSSPEPEGRTVEQLPARMAKAPPKREYSRGLII